MTAGPDHPSAYAVPWVAQAGSTLALHADLPAEVAVDGNDLGLLVGPRGTTLQALQELARVAAQRRLGDHDTRLRVDVGGYRERRKEALGRFAQQVAAQVVADGTAKRLEPMSSSDRKIVHDVLAEFAGTVTAVTSFGLFVTLDPLYVEGLVHITELGGEYYRFDEARQELRGERSGVKYAVGSRVRVQVSRVDLDGRRIDFRLVGDEDVPGGARNPREKASAAPSGGARSAPAGKRRPPLDIEDAGRGSLGGGGRKASSKSSTNTASAGKSRTQSTKAGGKTAKAKGRSARRT